MIWFARDTQEVGLDSASESEDEDCREYAALPFPLPLLTCACVPTLSIPKTFGLVVMLRAQVVWYGIAPLGMTMLREDFLGDASS
jgi:hypothetical protein